MRNQMLAEVQWLQEKIDHYAASFHPDSMARREQLWACLEWRLHKLEELERRSAEPS